jgi:G3E family GTPase
MRATVAVHDGKAQQVIDAWLVTTAAERRAVVFESPFVEVQVPEDVSVVRLGGACACCLGQLPLRVAIVRLMRSQRPEAVLLLLTGAGHADRVRALLADGSLGIRFDVE